ncbi:MAG TPA: HAMP domain-containing sensor histidine kinase, partial [Coriobacteriia bacterium]
VTYVVVANGMTDVATRETSRLAERAASEVRRAVTSSKMAARSEGLSGAQADAAADLFFSEAIPERFGVGQGFLEGHFAFYEPPDPEPRYLSDQAAAVEDHANLARAAANGESVEAHLGGRSMLANLLLSPDLGVYVVHVPFQRPSGRTWVLDVVYEPVRETDAIEQIRPPMLGIALVAVLLTVLVMSVTTSYLLRTINDLRVAADSVDAGELAFDLPESGHNEVSDLARSLNDLMRRLRRRAEAQTHFVADASHELATPVAGIRGYISILRGWGADDPEVREEALDAIDRESWRMMRLTRQLLALIRSEQELQFHSTRHDVNAVCREAIASAATRHAEKGIEFVGPDSGSLILLGDRERMEEVVSILVDNAAKYTDPGGRVSVTTSRRKGDILIEVSDTGHGIGEEELPYIWERFYRSDASRSIASGGFGLGLAIAKQIVESAGGLIDVESELGVGTTFTVRVPRGRD